MAALSAHHVSGRVLAASSDAHRPDSQGNYGSYKSNRSGRPLPGRPVPRRPIPERPVPYSTSSKSKAIKQPYYYRYYQDTDRGNFGCYWMARRAIDTNSRNWWARYRTCSQRSTH